MIEEFRDVLGYEGCYQVSNLGKVVSYHNNNRRILKANIGGAGYKQVVLFMSNTRKTMRIHKLVAIAFLNHTPCGYKEIVDHIDNNPLNNMVSNLQLITQRENLSKDKKGTSKYVGVSWDKGVKKWIAGITINGKKKHLGCFTDELEAAEAYQSKLKEL